MKTLTILKKASGICSGLALAAFLVAGLQSTAQAQQGMKPMKGGEHLMMLRNIDSTSQAEALKPGDSVAMVCAKCKSVPVQNVTTEKGHINVMTNGEKHLCPGCSSTVTVVGTGKGKTDKVTHDCDKCGSKSAFCCATKSGDAPSKGMDADKK